MQELTLGEVLGKGGFGTVLEIKGMEVCCVQHTPPSVMNDEEAKNNDDEKRKEFSEKSSIFSIDQAEDDKHKRNKKSHSFRLRRRRDHDQHGGTGKETIQFSNSHDGCEGLTENGLANISEWSILTSKSHDCVEGDTIATPTTAVTIGVKEGKRPPKRELRTKALSWSNAKAAAHHVHFFHRSPKHHDGEGKGFDRLHEQNKSMGDLNEEKKDPDEHQGMSRDRPREPRKKSVSYDESLLKQATGSISENDGARRGDRPVKRVSRNFSFLAWRDSEAGEEGDDAISPEELEKYNIDRSFYSTLPGTSVDAILDTKSGTEGSEEVDSDAHSGRSSLSGPSKELVVQTKVSQRGRRIVLYSTPKDGFSVEPPKEVVRTNIAQYQDNFITQNATVGTISTIGLATLNTINAQYQDKPFITQHATTNKGDARFVIKIISPNIVENDCRKFLQAAMDMATETYFLSALNHPHILTMRGVGQGDMFSPSYFLVLDRLYDTLSDRIEGAWKTQLDHLENSILVWNRASKLRVLWEERMGVMKDLAGALSYLHEMKIIYRDIKPENVGFDRQGNVKLFDFGLAKEVHEEDKCANGTYKLTPNTGSTRYMAPENGNKWPYNFSADSYSFGIMLWEITSLERPFSNYSPKEIRDMVMKWGERPKTKEDWSVRVVDLMKSAWDSNFRKRPTMKLIEETLKKEIEDSGVV